MTRSADAPAWRWRFRAVAAFGLGTGGRRAPRRRPSPRPTWPCRSGSARLRRSGLRRTGHAGPRRFVLGRHRRDADGGGEGGRARGHGGGRSGAGPAERWPAWPRTRGCRGARCGSGGAGGAGPRSGRATVPLLVALARAGLRPDSADSGRGGRGRRWPAGATRCRRRAARRPNWRAGSGAPSRWSTAPPASTAVAAQWWKTQVNLNAKAPAFAAALPELTHDELAGWGQSGDVTRQTMSLVLLRHAGEGPRRRRPVRGGAGGHRRGHGRHLRGAGRGRRRTRAASSTWRSVGTLVSLHLAGREGVDPGPVPAVDEAQAAGSADSGSCTVVLDGGADSTAAQPERAARPRRPAPAPSRYHEARCASSTSQSLKRSDLELLIERAGRRAGDTPRSRRGPRRPSSVGTRRPRTCRGCGCRRRRARQAAPG